MATTYQFHPENATPLGDWIWVFASNKAGMHNRGNAKVARLNFRATNGVGSGPTGNAYALPVFDANLKLLPLNQIRQEIHAFLDYAQNRPEANFFVTRIACAPGQFSDVTMAGMFAGASANCSLPQAWLPFILKHPPTSPRSEPITTKEAS